MWDEQHRAFKSAVLQGNYEEALGWLKGYGKSIRAQGRIWCGLCTLVGYGFGLWLGYMIW